MIELRRGRKEALKLIKVITLMIVSFFVFSECTAWAIYWDDEPKLKTPKINPYTYVPIKNLHQSSTEVDKRLRKSLPSVAPETPAIITDKDGNKQIYYKGKLRVKMDTEGNAKYYSGNQPRFEKDYEGKLTRKFEYNSPTCTIENEFGEVIGYQQYGQGGKLLREFDEDGFLIRTYNYSGRKLDWVIDEFSGTKTKYDIYGPEYETDFEGHKIGTFIRNGEGQLKWKIDLVLDENGKKVEGNKTVYDEKGRKPQYVLDYEGNIINRYNYGSYGRLESVTDVNGNVTEYNKHMPQEIRDWKGNLRECYTWEGTKLISKLDLEMIETTFYKNGKPTHITYYDGNTNYTLKNWIYIDGELKGVWDVESQTLTIFDHGRIARVDYWEGSPTIEKLKEWLSNNPVYVVDIS